MKNYFVPQDENFYLTQELDRYMEGSTTIKLDKSVIKEEDENESFSF